MQDQRGGGGPPKAQARGGAGFMTVLDAIDRYAAIRRAVMGNPEPAKPVHHTEGSLQSDPPRVSVDQVKAERKAAKDFATAVRQGKLHLYCSRTGSALPAQLSPGDVEYLYAKVRVDEVIALADPWGDLDAALPDERTSVVDASAAEADETVHHSEGESSAPEETPVTQTKPRSRAESQDAAILDAIRALEHDPLRLPPSRGGRGGGVRAQVKRFVERQHASLFPPASKVFQHAWDRLRSDRLIMDRSPE